MNTGDKIYANTPSGGSPLGFNSLVTRLETLRTAHYNADKAAGSANSNLATSFSNIASTSSLATKTNVDALKANIVKLETAINLKGKGYSTSITVPAVGDLIKATTFNNWSTVISNMEAQCANYGRYSGQYGSQYGGQYGSQYGQYGAYGSQYGSQYGWYTQRYGQYGRYGKGGGCFVKDTLILLLKGNLIPIQDIQLGDIVVSYDEKTKSFNSSKVKGIENKEIVNNMVTITFTDETNLQCTVGHPILTQDGWKAIDPFNTLEVHGLICNPLNINDVVLSPHQNKIIKLIQLYTPEKPIHLYNLQLQEYHTYIANDVVVHNDKQIQSTF